MSSSIGKLLLVGAALLVGIILISVLLGGWFGMIVGALAGLWVGMHFAGKIFDGGLSMDNMKTNGFALGAIALVSLILGPVIGLKLFTGVLIGELIGAGWKTFKHLKK